MIQLLLEASEALFFTSSVRVSELDMQVVINLETVLVSKTISLFGWSGWLARAG